MASDRIHAVSGTAPLTGTDDDTHLGDLQGALVNPEGGEHLTAAQGQSHFLSAVHRSR